MLNQASQFLRGLRKRTSSLVQMLHARLQILHVRSGECVLIQAVHSRVDLLHSPAEIGHQRAAFACEIVNAGFSRAADVRVWRSKSFRLPSRHYHVYEAIAE